MITHSFSSTLAVVMPISANVWAPRRDGSLRGGGGSDIGPSSCPGGGVFAESWRRPGGPKFDCCCVSRGPAAEFVPGSESA